MKHVFQNPNIYIFKNKEKTHDYIFKVYKKITKSDSRLSKITSESQTKLKIYIVK